MRFEHEPFVLADILDAKANGSEWAALSSDGRLGDLRIDLRELDQTRPVDLHVIGDVAAVVERHGRRGRVFSGARVTMELDRGGYHPETSVFPCALFEREGRTLIVHGTDWNRLDVSDPSTGERLTPRGPTACSDAKNVPPHYLDYFHARLLVSPVGQWIAEDGWYWHPLGELRVWSMDDWLARSVWESEDGPSLRSVAQRTYFWDTPMAWTDPTHLAFWGKGDDAEEMRPVVRIYDAALDQETGRIEGPEVTPAFPWPPGSTQAGWLAFDGRLIAVSPELGTGVWSLDGERLHFEPGFAPRRYHPIRREFLSWGEDGAWVSRLVP